jgi:hypothetical protein
LAEWPWIIRRLRPIAFVVRAGGKNIFAFLETSVKRGKYLLGSREREREYLAAVRCFGFCQVIMSEWITAS